MGGSGVAGDVVRALYRDRSIASVDVVKEPTLPEYCGRDTLVVASSYSGNTAETLTCFEQAVARGCRVLAVSAGGELSARATAGGAPVVTIPAAPPAPRAALGLLVLGMLGAFEAMGLVPALADEVADVAGTLDELSAELAPEREEPRNPAKDLARWIGDTIPVVWGAEGLGSVAAARWKTELNENAKVPAFSGSLPELDHNEVAGWSAGAGERFSLIALRHEGEHPDVAARVPVSIEIASESGMHGREVWARGRSALSRFMSLAAMGGATSVYLGIARGFDPAPIAAIDRLKRGIEEER